MNPSEKPSGIDPIEFFDFLAELGPSSYPTNGYRLGEAARSEGYSDQLVRFFEGMPGSFESEADIMPYAENLNTPPYGTELDLPDQTIEELRVDDIVSGESPDENHLA
jgi:hypothetical protein